jgi:hypothetical protein
MTFNAAVPLNSDSPGIFPAQNQTNMARLQTLLGADHQFNLTAAANDGWHNVVHLTQQAPSGVLAATGRLYAKSSASRIHAFYMDDTGAEYQMTPTMPIRAAVNFNGTGANGVKTMRSQFNVASVTKTATGAYTIAFTTAMPDANYIVMATGMRATVGDISNGQVTGDTTYSNSVTTTSVKVQFNGGSSSLADVLMGNIIILSAT